MDIFRKIHEVAVAVTAANHNGIYFVVGSQHIRGDFHRGHAGAATILHVYTPRVCRAYSVLNIAGGRGERIFLPLLADTQNNVYFFGVDAGVFQAFQSRLGSHFLSSVIGTGQISLFYSEFVYNGVLAPHSVGESGNFRRFHGFFGKIRPYADNSYVNHNLLLL